MFRLAERLGMTISELETRMSAREIIEWMAHDELTAWEHEQARAEAKAKAGR